MSESVLDRLRSNVRRNMADYHKDWVGFASSRSDAPRINERDKRYRPRTICMLGCCLTAPQDNIAKKLLDQATSLIRNLARLCQKQKEKIKSNLALSIALGSCFDFCVHDSFRDIFGRGNA